MRNRLCRTVLSLAVVLSTAGGAFAALVTEWTFEPGTAGNPPSATGTTIGGISPSTGAGTASGVHAVCRDRLG